MTRAVVLTSIEDDTGTRCVDILRLGDGRFAFRECRRDPEDGHGWRYTSLAAPDPYPTLDAARQAARDSVAWLAT